MNDRYRDYIYNGIDLVQQKPKTFKKAIVLMSFIPALGVVYTFLLGGRYTLLGVLMLTVILTTVIHTWAIAANITLKNLLECRLMLVLNMMLSFTLWAIVLFGQVYALDYRVVFLLLPPVITMTIRFVIDIRRIKNTNLEIKKVESIKTKGPYLLAGLIGYWLAKIFITNVSQGIVICILGSCLGAWLMDSLLKLYYLRKLP